MILFHLWRNSRSKRPGVPPAVDLAVAEGRLTANWANVDLALSEGLLGPLSDVYQLLVSSSCPALNS